MSLNNPVEPAPGFHFVYNPDLKLVSDLIVKTWARPCWHYDVGLLELHIMRPTGDPSLTIGQVSKTGELVSYVAFMPFDIEYRQRRYRTVFCSFMTVATDYHGRGLNAPQQVALVEKAVKLGYDLYTVICEDGAVSNVSLERIFARLGLGLKRVRVMGYLGCRNDLVQPILPVSSSERTRRLAADDLASVTELVESMGKGCDLRKMISPLDVEFLFLGRPHARTFVYVCDGKIRALANLLILEVLDSETSVNVYFENVHFGDLSDAEQLEFVGDCLIQLQDTGFRMAILPDIGYVNTEPFRKYRFRAMPRQLNLYMTELKPGIIPGGVRNINSFYLDIY